MNTYLIESCVHGPALIDALTREEATQQYLNNVGYLNTIELVEELGDQFGIVNAEIISENYSKFTH